MRKILMLITVLLLISCKDLAAEPCGNFYYFENPQPINDSELSKIPNKFQGVFMDSDSVFMNVKDNIILFEHFLKFKVHKNKMDSLKLDFDYSNGTYISKIDKDVYEVKNIGDSIEFFTKEIDTFFVFSNAQKMKRINNHLILNAKDSIYWRIKVLSLEKNILKLKYIYSDRDLIMMDSITKSKSKMLDSSSFILRPTRREFKSILSLKELGEEQRFKKV